jgi:hypothetical protein
VLRFNVCDYSLDLTAPPGHPSDGYRVMNDYFMTAIQPMVLPEGTPENSTTVVKENGAEDETSASDDAKPDAPKPAADPNVAPRSVCNLRSFCMLIGLLIKQGHLDQSTSRKRMIHLFATLMEPRGPYQMDHMFTSLITHIGQCDTATAGERAFFVSFCYLHPLFPSTHPSLLRHHHRFYLSHVFQIYCALPRSRPPLTARTWCTRACLHGMSSDLYVPVRSCVPVCARREGLRSRAGW